MRGLLSIDELRNLVEADEIDTVVVGFTDHYGRLHGKRFDAGFFLEDVHSAGTHACSYLLTVDMEMEPVPGFSYANWEKGYGDFHMVPDMATLRLADWLPRTAVVLCDLHDTTTHEPVAVAPRSILRRQLERAAAMGYSAQAATELEYFHLRGWLSGSCRSGLRQLAPGWLVHRGLSLVAGNARGAVQRGRAAASGAVGDPG